MLGADSDTPWLTTYRSGGRSRKSQVAARRTDRHRARHRTTIAGTHDQAVGTCRQIADGEGSRIRSQVAIDVLTKQIYIIRWACAADYALYTSQHHTNRRLRSQVDRQRTAARYGNRRGNRTTPAVRHRDGIGTWWKLSDTNCLILGGKATSHRTAVLYQIGSLSARREQ